MAAYKQALIILEDVEHKTEIDRIGLQIHKDSTTFSDNATGSIPQIDAIIKTTDGKIYKATQNLNSTYTDYDGNKTTTTNAAEPMGASMCEKFMKEYEWRNNDGYTYTNLIYNNGIYLCIDNDTYEILYSKNGKSWKKANSHGAGDIVFCNNKFIISNSSVYSCTYEYSSDGITWIDGSINSEYVFLTNIWYANGKYVSIIGTNGGDIYSIYSSNLIDWTLGNKIDLQYDSMYSNTDSGIFYSLTYGNTKFVAVGTNAYNGSNFSYSTDGINWTTGMISPFPYIWSKVKYINNKFYAFGRAQAGPSMFSVMAYSADGINWTIPSLKWVNGTDIITDGFRFDFCKYNTSLLIGVFSDVNVEYNSVSFVLAKSSNGITWEKIYNLGNEQQVEELVCTNDGIVLIGNDFYSEIGYVKLLHYTWTVNAKSGEDFSGGKVPNGTACLINSRSYSRTYTVDTTYDANSIDKHSTGAYRFSGWSQTGNITFTKDSPRVTEITGTWNWVDMVKYSYSWNAPSYSDLTGLVTLPNSGSVYAGDTVSVDTKYASDSVAENCEWSTGLLPSDEQWSCIAYGNSTFVIGSQSSSSNMLYSTDGINWNTTLLPISTQCTDICYALNLFVCVSRQTILYSTDGINWTNASVSGDWQHICYGNGLFAALNNNLTNNYAYSTDGINWTKISIPRANTSYGLSAIGICYGNGVFVAGYGSSMSTSMYTYSTDGINWVEGSLPIDKSWNSVNFCNGKFFFSNKGDNKLESVYYSTDGINWTALNSNTAYSFGDMVKYKGLIIVGCETFADDFYSSDGLKWYPIKAENGTAHIATNGEIVIKVRDTINYDYLTSIPTTYYSFSGWNPSTDFIISEDKTISGTWSKKNKLRVSYSWSNQPSGMTSKLPSDEYYHYGDNVIIDTTYNNKSGYKGLNTSGSISNVLIKTGIESLLSFNAFSYQNNIYFLSCEYNATTDDKTVNKLYYSSNGTSWSQTTLPMYCRYFTNVCYGNGVYVMAGSDEDLNSTYLFFSSKGSSWAISTSTSSTNGCPRNICYGNGKFILIGDDGFDAWIAYSTNGNTWTFKDLWKGNSSKDFGHYIIYNDIDKLFVTSGAYYSTDGITWNYNGTGGNNNGNICYGNGIYVIGGDLTTGSYYSYNGKDWIANSSSVINISNVDHFPYYIDFYDGYFYSVNGYRTQSKYGKTINIPIMYSIDGINWNYIIKQSPIISSNYGSQILDGKHVNGTYYLIFRIADNIQKIDLNTAYYKLSGWDKSDFNITSDTSITASWSTVSSGDGLNFID